MKLLLVPSALSSISFYLLVQIAGAFVTVFQSPHQLSKTITTTTLHIKISDLKKNSGAASNRVFRYNENERSSSSKTSNRVPDGKEERSPSDSQKSSNRYGTRSARKNLFSHNLPMTVSGSESLPSDCMPGGSSMPYGNIRTDRPAFTYGPEIPEKPLFDHNTPVTKDRNDPRQSTTPYTGYGPSPTSDQRDEYADHRFEERPPSNEERYDQAYPYNSSEPPIRASYGYDERGYSTSARVNDESQRYSDFRYDSSNTPPRQDNRGNQYVGGVHERYNEQDNRGNPYAVGDNNEHSHRSFDYDQPHSSQIATSNNDDLQASTYDQQRSSRSFDFGPTCSVVQDCKAKKYEEVENAEYAPKTTLFDHNTPVMSGIAFNERRPFNYGPSDQSSAPLFDHNKPVEYDGRHSYPGRPIDSPYVRDAHSSSHNNFSYGPESSVVTDYYDSGKTYYDEQIDGDYETTWQPSASDSYMRPSNDAGHRREFTYGPGTNDVSSNKAYGYEPEPYSPYVPPIERQSVENNYGNSLVVLNDESNHKPFYYGGSDPSTKPLFDHNKPVADNNALYGNNNRQPFHYGSSQPSSTPLFDHNRPVTEEDAMNVKSYAAAPQYRNNLSKTNLDQIPTTTVSSSAGMDIEDNFESREAEYSSTITSLDCMLSETTPKLTAIVQEATEALSALERWKDFVNCERERLD